MAKAAQTDARRGGAKLNRSETVTVRLDPRLNYLCELAARSQRRTKSSFIEWAVEQALKIVEVPNTSEFGASSASVEIMAATLWSVDEVDRLVALAFHAPTLMDHDEQLLWRAIRQRGHFWRGHWFGVSSSEYEEWTWTVDENRLDLPHLRDHYDALKAYVTGQTDGSDLPKSLDRRKKQAPKATPGGAFDSDLDEDVPF